MRVIGAITRLIFSSAMALAVVIPSRVVELQSGLARRAEPPVAPFKWYRISPELDDYQIGWGGLWWFAVDNIHNSTVFFWDTDVTGVVSNPNIKAHLNKTIHHDRKPFIMAPYEKFRIDGWKDLVTTVPSAQSKNTIWWTAPPGSLFINLTVHTTFLLVGPANSVLYQLTGRNIPYHFDVQGWDGKRDQQSRSRSHAAVSVSGSPRDASEPFTLSQVSFYVQRVPNVPDYQDGPDFHLTNNLGYPIMMRSISYRVEFGGKYPPLNGTVDWEKNGLRQYHNPQASVSYSASTSQPPLRSWIKQVEYWNDGNTTLVQLSLSWIDMRGGKEVEFTQENVFYNRWQCPYQNYCPQW